MAKNSGKTPEETNKVVLGQGRVVSSEIPRLSEGVALG